MKAIVTTKREGEEFVSEFSVDDAKKAGLWGKQDRGLNFPSAC